MLLDMTDPCRDGKAEVLCCNSSGQVFSLEEQEAALIDCANQAAVPLNPGQTVFGSCLEGAVYPYFHFQVILVKLDLVHAQSDRGPGELAALPRPTVYQISCLGQATRSGTAAVPGQHLHTDL
jgi:hypothetical protein